MSFRRVPREIDPRRPPKRRGGHDRDAEAGREARSYGQYIDISPEELAELERATGEVVREGTAGDAGGSGNPAAREQRRAVEAREEFEDATDEVSREDGNSGC